MTDVQSMFHALLLALEASWPIPAILFGLLAAGAAICEVEAQERTLRRIVKWALWGTLLAMSAHWAAIVAYQFTSGQFDSAAATTVTSSEQLIFVFILYAGTCALSWLHDRRVARSTIEQPDVAIPGAAGADESLQEGEPANAPEVTK